MEEELWMSRVIDVCQLGFCWTFVVCTSGRSFGWNWIECVCDKSQFIEAKRVVPIVSTIVLLSNGFLIATTKFKFLAQN